MPTRFPWSRHEVALLIDAYLQIANGTDLSKTAIELSVRLRYLAVHTGRTIDDTSA